jgi:hypothetical protein
MWQLRHDNWTGLVPENGSFRLAFQGDAGAIQQKVQAAIVEDRALVEAVVAEKGGTRSDVLHTQLAGYRKRDAAIVEQIKCKEDELQHLLEAPAPGSDSAGFVIEKELEQLKLERETIGRHLDRLSSTAANATYIKNAAIVSANAEMKARRQRELISRRTALLDKVEASIAQAVAELAEISEHLKRIDPPNFAYVGHGPTSPPPPERFIEASDEIKELFRQPDEPIAMTTY